MPAFALTIFAGAFLLFQVQPLIGEYILLWFGGGPGVWTACMLFFQVLLLGGYAYAHLISRWFRPRTQAILHLVLVLAALAMLPITPSESWKPTGAGNPTLRILALLSVSLGLPYFVLSSTGPLMQQWFSHTNPGRSPYRLYSLSNAGSLLALISYPFLFEPFFGRRTLSVVWMSAFALFVVLFAASALLVLRVPRALPADPGEPSSVPLRSRALWIVLPAFASAMLLASTNQMCEDVIVMPFFWVLPLAAYLVSFILTFDRPTAYRPRFYALFTAVLVFGSAAFHRAGTNDSMFSLVQIASILAATFGVSMLCHGELARLKPAPRHLTSYYLSLSAGG